MGFSKTPITFNPGPSQLSSFIIKELQELASSGFLSASHRSSAFIEISKQAILGLHEKMEIPAEYKIFYQPSATVAMDTILKNLVVKKSFHFVHGAFSSLFHKTAKEIGLEALDYETKWDQPIDWENASIPNDAELICVTHNETSSGLMWPSEELFKLRNQYPNQLLAIDVTSSFGSMKMAWEQADIWFGSVQKCLGLPSGLGYILVSPRAFEKAKNAKRMAAWQSFISLDDKMQQFQTPETPNMVDIALLAKQMSQWNLLENEGQLLEKAMLLYDAKFNWKPYIKSEEWRSPTVACFLVDNPELWHAQAKKEGMVLGKGYGPLKDTTIRIANFPAITLDHIQRLLQVLSAK